MANVYKGFKCPHRKGNKNSICPTCRFAGTSKVHVSYEKNKKGKWIGKRYYKKSTREYVRTPIKGCREWLNKIYASICGCYGEVKCECGYREDSCFQDQLPEKCPFCNRPVETKLYDRSWITDIDWFQTEPKIKSN